MTDEEKAKWFDLMLKEDFQILHLDDGTWVAGGGYQGAGAYDWEGRGATLQEAYDAYKAERDIPYEQRRDAALAERADREKLRTRFIQPADLHPGRIGDTWGGGMA